MAEILIPPWIIPSDEDMEEFDRGTIPFAPTFGSGVTQRQSFSDPVVGISRFHKAVRMNEQGGLIAALKAARGKYHTVRSRVHLPQRGSFPLTEFLVNGTFENAGTWNGSSATQSYADRRARMTVTGQGGRPQLNQSVSLGPYIPYVLRAMQYPRFNSSAPTYGVMLDDGTVSSTSFGSTNYSAAVIVPITSPVTASIAVIDDISAVHGDFIEVPWASLSQCMLADNGANFLRWSDEFDDAVWTATNASVDDNITASLDGNDNADALEENTTNGVHTVSQAVTVASNALDYCFGVAIKRGTRDYATLTMTTTSSVSVVVSLLTGAFGTPTVGANWSNVRTHVVDNGNGWYTFYLTARKGSGTTSLTATIGSASTITTPSYAGVSGADAVYLYRATLAQSSFPMRLVLTAATANSDGDPQTGGGIFVKGAPASTNGLLLLDDVIEINGELKQCTGILSSDSAGMGFLSFSPDLFNPTSVVSETPIIVKDPMGKFMMSNLKIKNRFGVYADVSYDLEHIYE
jgi:hypothetical protein